MTTFCEENGLPKCYSCIFDSVIGGECCILILYKEWFNREEYIDYFAATKSIWIDKALDLFHDQKFAGKIRLKRLLR